MSDDKKLRAEIENKVYNIDILIEEMKTIPHTYCTILTELFQYGTLREIARRKLNDACSRGKVFRSSLPKLNRFGTNIYYHPQKDYQIVVYQNNRIEIEVLYFRKCEKIEGGNFHYKLNDYYKLIKDEWVIQTDEKILFEGNILRWI